MIQVNITRRALIGTLASLASVSLASVAYGEPIQSFDAVLHQGNHEVTVGRMTLDPRARLAVVSAEPDRADWLRRLAVEVNATDVMHVDVAPTPDAPTFTSASRIIRRGDPEFVPALKNYIRTYYDIEMRPR
jgi:hypothetical protein